MWIDDFRSIMKDTGEDKFYDTHYFGRVDSTNEVIKRAFRTGRLTLSPDEGDIVQGEHDSDRNSAPASPKEGFLVIGEEQTAGKGRIGRKWVSPAGESVYFSFLLQPKVDSEHVSALTLVMGLSVAQAVRSVLAQTARIKWPNDIVIHGKKICGILTEAQAGPEGLDYVVIGTGINVNNRQFPPELKDATSLAIEEGKKVPRALILAAVLKAFHSNYRKFCEAGDMSTLVSDYDFLLVDKDEKVRIEDPRVPYVAVSRGIDEYGRLNVEREDGTKEKIATGEVSVRGIYGYV